MSKTTRIEGSAEEITAEQVKVISDIQATTDKLCGEGARQVCEIPLILLWASKSICMYRWCHHITTIQTQ